MFRLERAFYLHADIVSLILAQFRQLDADFLQMQAGDFFIQFLGQNVDAGRIVITLGPKLNLRQNLIGE